MKSPDYLDLLEKVLLYSFWDEPKIAENGSLRPNDFVTDEERRTGCAAWPSMAFTMIGELRLRNIRVLCDRAVADNVPGGFCECGVWRGGACIYARACLPSDRPVYVCDSFCGMPLEEGERWWQQLEFIKVASSKVISNFEKFGLLTNVKFVPGFFKKSLSSIDGPLAVLRLDGDMYSSTMDSLRELWPKVSPGGFLIVDDYGTVPECKQAVTDYFPTLPTIQHIDASGVWFRKE